MRTAAILSVLIMLTCAVFAPRARAEDAGDEKIKKALARKVTFEFVDTPLSDALNFIQQLCNVSIVLDPKAVANGKDQGQVNLRVADMEAGVALQWILKLGELEYKIKDQVIFVSAPADRNIAEKIPRKENDAAANAGILRARFATGDAIEADAALLRQFPHLAQEILSFGYDPAKDKILALAPGRDFPAPVSVTIFVESAKTVAPDAQYNFDENLKLLFVRSKDDNDLRRVNAIARALRRAMPDGGAGHVHGAQKITLKVADKPLREVLDRLGAMVNLKCVAIDKAATERFKLPITLDFNDMEMKDCLNMVAKLTDLRFEYQGNNTIGFAAAGEPKAPERPVKPPRPPDEPKEKTPAEQQF